MMDLLNDKKLVIGTLVSIALVFIVFIVAGYINLPFIKDQGERDSTIGPGSCLVLEEKYCEQARFYTIDAKGTEAAVFNLPNGTKLYMPFDGAYFDDSQGGQEFNKIRLGIPDSPAFVLIQGNHTPALSDGASVSKGDVIGTVLENNLQTSDPSDFNIIIYGENYDLVNLFE